MAINPVAIIAAGCNQNCGRAVVSSASTLAYCSTTAIYIHTPTQRPTGQPTSARSAPTTTSEAEKTYCTYPLTRVLGSGVSGSIQSFDFNEEYVSCVMSAGSRVAIWRLADGEPLYSKRVPSSVGEFFKREGAPSHVRVAGKHHILFATTTGWIISVNMNDGATTHQLKLSVPDDKRGSAAAVGNVTCMDVSPMRPDIIAVGTSEGLLFAITLHPANGMRQTSVLRPLASVHSSSGPNTANAAHNGEKKIHTHSSSNNYDNNSLDSSADLVNAPSALTVIAFDPNNMSSIAVGSREGALVLVDISTSTVLQSFEINETAVVSIAWLAGQAGVFLTADGESNKLRVWSLNNRAVTGTWHPAVAAGTAINGVSSFAHERLLLALHNGGVSVYNTQTRGAELLTEPSHTDVMHDCRYAYHDKELAASVSSDGTIRVWNTKQLLLQHTIDVGCVIAYSVDWSPSGKYIIASLSNGEVVCYHVSTQRENWRVAVAPGDVVRRVTWSKAESSAHIAAAYRTGVTLLSARDGKIIRRYKTKSPVLGVDFDPRHARQLAAGCQDGQIFLFQITSNREEPAAVLTGHTESVCNVQFNPAIPNFLLSASHDTTLRVWDVSSTDAHTVSVTSRVLSGHTDSVLGIAWCSLAPYLVLSGSCDCTVRVWDIRNGATVATVRAHNSDVFALSSHPERPLVFLSASRDGTIVFWHLALLGQVYLDAALGSLDRLIVPEVTALLSASSTVNPFVVSGEAVAKLNHDLKDTGLKPQKRLERIVGFFEFPCGALDLVRVAAYQSDPQESSNAKCLVVPTARLVEARTNRAKTLMEKAHGKSVSNSGPAYKKSRLVEAADAMLQVGKITEYCQLMAEAGEWESAIAAAPVVSREFWRTLCLQAAAAMESVGDPRAVRFYIMGEDSARAARCSSRASDRNWDAAVVIGQTCPQRSEATPMVSNLNPNSMIPPLQPSLMAVSNAAAEPPHQTSIDTNGESAVVKELLTSRAASFTNAANPRIAAAAQLADGANDEAVMRLIHCGDVALAHLLIHTVPLRQQSTIDAGYHMSMLHSCCQQQWETALLCATRQSNPLDGLAVVFTLFQHAQGKPKPTSLDGATPAATTTTTTSSAPLEKVMGFHKQVLAECQRLQLPLDMESIQRKHASDGLASSNQLAAMALSPNTPVGITTCEELVQTVGNFIENLLQAALQDIDGANAIFYLKQAYSVSCYVSLPLCLSNPSSPQASLNVSVPLLSPNATPTHSPRARKFLALVYLVAALMCVKVYRFPKLLNPAFTKARELSGDSAAAAALLAKAQQVLGSYSPHSAEVQCAPLGIAVPVLSNTDGTQLKSAITSETLWGSAHLLEDGTSLMAKAEALQWMQCCAFSPLASGARILPL